MRNARAIVTLAAAAACASPLAYGQKPAAKISDGVVKIGLLLDMSSLYAD
jgi:branched-chain amino acid transport system substrate-binding protein